MWPEISSLVKGIVQEQDKRIAKQTAARRLPWPCCSMIWVDRCEYGLPPEAELLASVASMEEKPSSATGRAAVGTQDGRVQEACSLSEKYGKDCGQSPASGPESGIPERELLLLMAGDGGDDGWSEPSWTAPNDMVHADECPPPAWGLGPLSSRVPAEDLGSQIPPPAAEVPWPSRVLGPSLAPPVSAEFSCSQPPPSAAEIPCPHLGLGPLPAEMPRPARVIDLFSASPCALSLSSLRVGGGPGFEGLMEGLVAQLMPLITEMIQKAIAGAEALGKGLAAEGGTSAARTEAPIAEPRLKRHKGGGRDPKRKNPETSEFPSGRGAASAGTDADPSGHRRVVRGKGAGGAHAAPSAPVAPAAPADGGWQTVQRKREETEPFELRGQDWDVPIVPHDAIGRKLDDLPEGKPLEAVILASKANLDTVRTILQGTSKPHRIMCVELKKDGKERIPGKVGNQLRFKQADITTHFSQGTAAPRYAGKKAAAVTIAPTTTTTTTTTTTVYIRIPAAFCSAERWKEIRGSPAKTVAAWAAEQRVVLADSWGWVEETLPKQGKQLFGKARLAEKEMSSLLCCSGRGGIFVDCIRDAIPAQVQWLARIDNEPATAYLERGLRMSAQLGLGLPHKAAVSGLVLLGTLMLLSRGYGCYLMCLLIGALLKSPRS